jgi:biotin carboxylase
VNIAGLIKTDFYNFRLNRSSETLLSREHRYYFTNTTISLEDFIKLRAQISLRVLFENHENLIKLRAQASLYRRDQDFIKPRAQTLFRRVGRKKLEKQT